MRNCAFLVAALAFAGSARAEELTDRAERMIAEWRISEARAETDQLLKSHGDDPEVVFLDGNVKFLTGDYEGAVERMTEAIDHARGSGVADWRELRDLVASTAKATHGFTEQRSPEGHFIVRYAPGKDELLVPYAFEALEAAYQEVGQHDFGMGENDPIRVEIFGEVADLAKVSTLTLKEIETSGTIALCKFNRLMIVSPRALGRGYPWQDTLTHEYTHFVVTRVSRNSVPIWFHEGLAKYEETRWRHGEGQGLTPTMEHLLATALLHGRRLITFDEMYPSMAKLPSQADTALAFAEVYTVVAYLLEQKGWTAVRAVVDKMKDGKGDARAVADVLGESFNDFQNNWKAWLKSKHWKTHPGLIPSSLKFKKHPGKASDDDDTQEITEDRARKFARLAGMLRTRGRLAPAAVEYEKAQVLVGPGHPLIANKLARTYLDLNEPDKAIATAEPALALYPDLGSFSATLGEAWVKKGQPERAAPYLEATIRISPFDPAPHCALAPIYSERGKEHAARAEREANACKSLVHQ
jgi:tetratricopeptide (TPR) repeat protein